MSTHSLKQSKQPRSSHRPCTGPALTAAATSPAIEPFTAEAAYRALSIRLDHIAREQLEPLNIDVQAAAVFALGISRLISVPSTRVRFARLARSGEYDDTCVDDLAAAAHAAWYARHRYLLEAATRSEAQLPTRLVETAVALRGRLLRLADYWLQEDKTVAAELTAIRIGTGYQDLANDLIALAALTERHHAVLSQDRKLFQPGDAALAKQLAADILEKLGAAATAEQHGWSTAQARAWTHLARTYEEVQRGGRFLFANDDGEARFPSLVTVARSTAVRGHSKESVPAPAPAPSEAEPAAPA